MSRRKRREQGSGSVYRAKGRGWVAQRELPIAEGKRRVERRYFGPGKAGHDQALGQVARWETAALALGRHPRAGDTLRAWCAHWLTTRAGVVAPRTIEFYERHIGYATAQIGDIRLVELQPQDIRDMLAALMPTEDRPGLSPRSRAHVRTVLRAALAMAVNDGVLSRNPCDAVEAPKVTKYEAYALRDAELAALFQAVAGTRLDAMWRLLADFGMRIDEILSTHWADFDQERKTLRIRGTKTDRERYLSLSEQHVVLLTVHWTALQDERSDNPKWKEHGYLFPSEVGTKLLQSNARRAFKAALKVASLPARIRIHDLRHTAATNLIAAGNDIPTVQYITGHADSAVLLEIYAHHQEDRNREAVEKVEQKRQQRRG